MRTVHLVRHALAGVRGTWPGDDLERALTAEGHAQAAALVGVLADVATEVHTSRAVRCRDTVAPLAEAAGLALHEEPLLLEGADPTAALDWLRGLPDGAVACSHGDVIGGVLTILSAQGLRGEHTTAWPKGGRHELLLDGDEVTRVTLHRPEPT